MQAIRHDAKASFQKLLLFLNSKKDVQIYLVSNLVSTRRNSNFYGRFGVAIEGFSRAVNLKDFHIKFKFFDPCQIPFSFNQQTNNNGCLLIRKNVFPPKKLQNQKKQTNTQVGFCFQREKNHLLFHGKYNYNQFSRQNGVKNQSRL